MKQVQGSRFKVQVLATVVLLCCCAGAQEIRFGDARPVSRQHVELLTDAVEVRPGQAQVVELRFRVDPGFHINSHTPKDELMVPTVFKVDSGANVAGVEYPAGAAFQLADGSTLDVYQGEFRVRVRLVAGAGKSVMTGSLRYQACDSAACFPAKTLAVRVLVTGQ